MKRVLPFVIVAIMAGLTSWGMSQGFRCFPGRFAWFPSGNRVPVPLVQQQPLVPVFQYPLGIVPTMSNVPIPTRNPMFDVDHSPLSVDLPSSVFPAPTFAPVPTVAPVPNLSVAGGIGGGTSSSTLNLPSSLFDLTPPVQSTPLRFQPVPAFSPTTQGFVVAGRFDSVPGKRSIPIVTPEIFTEEAPIVVTPDTTEDVTEDSDPFGSPADEDDESVEDDAPVIAPPLEADDDDAEDSDPFGSPADEDDESVEDDAPVVVPPLEADDDDAEDSDPFGSPFDDDTDDSPVVAPTLEADDDDLDPFDEF